jgi:glutamate dehydrogenase
VVEGANLFFTDDARRSLELAGVHVFKDSSANKGGVTSSSLEVLASLAMVPADHDCKLCPGGKTQNSEFYNQYVEEIIKRIEENCRDEFSALLRATGMEETVDAPSSPTLRDATCGRASMVKKLRQQCTTAEPISPMRLSDASPQLLKSEASKRISHEINALQDTIMMADLDDSLIRNVLSQSIPKLLLDHCGLDGLLSRVPPAYVKAIVANWIAAKFIYTNGIHEAHNSVSFHRFLNSLSEPIGRTRLCTK